MPRTTEYLKVTFTREERAEFALELARATQGKAEIELRKKEIAAKIKAEIEEHDTLIAGLARKVHDGYDFKDVEVEIIFDKPQPGEKSIYRKDTGEFVAKKRMSDEDRQMVIDLESRR